MRTGDAAFVAACRDAGFTVGIGSGLLLLSVRKVFDAGCRHFAWRHMSDLWDAHEAMNRRLLSGLEDEGMRSDMMSIRSHIEHIRERYLK